ncbi:MAG: ABC transporter ATP-binding protein/permease [Oligoflexia bacterium]|nr:ABC transporter ATP-binding protein/permease [Oligoflexia bacterium]
MSALKLLSSNLDHLRSRFALIVLVGLIDSIICFFVPVALSDFTRSDFSTQHFLTLSILVASLYLSSLPLQYVLRKWGESFASLFASHLRLKYFRHLEQLPATRLLAHHSAYVLSLVGSVSDGLGGLCVEIFWGLTRTAVNLLLFLIFAARESTVIASTNFGILVVFVAVSTRLSFRMVPLVSELNHRRASLGERYIDFATNILTIRKLGIQTFAEQKLQLGTDSTNQQVLKVQAFHATRWFILHFLFGCAYLTTIIFMLSRIAFHGASPALLVLFVATFSMVKGNVERLSENFKTLFEVNTYTANLTAIAGELQASAPRPPATSWHRIECVDLAFTYGGQSKTIRVPNFTLTPGDKVLISGQSGQGKTTFIHILCGFFSPQQGRVLIDAEPAHEQLSGSTVVIAQESELFNISLRDNLLLGRQLSDELLNARLEELDLLSWIQSLDNGLDTRVGERGIKVSAGQRQRLNLLRGLLLDRSLYLIDEPTAHMDPFTEKRVIAFISKHLSSKTVLIVSHRPGFEEFCPRKYSFQDHILEPI